MLTIFASGMIGIPQLSFGEVLPRFDTIAPMALEFLLLVVTLALAAGGTKRCAIALPRDSCSILVQFLIREACKQKIFVARLASDPGTISVEASTQRCLGLTELGD